MPMGIPMTEATESRIKEPTIAWPMPPPSPSGLYALVRNCQFTAVMPL
jgi:hypothetical protein